jgi:Ca2+-binding EF-hand superfamily protein
MASSVSRKSPAVSHNNNNSASAGDNYRISKAEVEQAFAFFDKSGTGVLRPRDLKSRLSAFYPHMTNKECRFLISEPNFTVDKLWSLLENNTVTNFDPVKEAFRVYDPNGTGFVDTEVLKGIMKNLGYGSDLTADDLEVLIRTADVDGDGKVSLEDFRNMLSQPRS